jgi:hypothetical protein
VCVCVCVRVCVCVCVRSSTQTRKDKNQRSERTIPAVGAEHFRALKLLKDHPVYGTATRKFASKDWEL